MVIFQYFKNMIQEMEKKRINFPVSVEEINTTFLLTTKKTDVMLRFVSRSQGFEDKQLYA